jgi:hypothetical protein
MTQGLPVDILAQRESVVTSVTLRASDAQLPDHLLGFFRVLLASPEEQRYAVACTSTSISFTGARGVSKYKIGLGRG